MDPDEWLVLMCYSVLTLAVAFLVVINILPKLAG
jgi:hypothetical protein